MNESRNFIPLAKPHITEDEVKAVEEVIRSGWWTTGPKVTEFENAIAGYLGSDLHCVALNSCTAGLYLALKSLGIGVGDEVIVPTWTFAATAHVVEWAGATPILCDVLPGTLSLDPDKTKASVTTRTKAIIPVHLAGYPCEIAEITKIAGDHDLCIIEDAAHALGTRYSNQKIGSFGFASVFSFYATKNLACGEGGMLVTSNRTLAESVRKLSYFGIDKTAYQEKGKGAWYYEIQDLGYKFNFDSLHAALGLVQLRKLDEMNDRRREIAGMYSRHLKHVSFFDYSSAHHHTYHLFMVRLPDRANRDLLIERLRTRSIGSGVHYIPLHLHPYFRGKFPEQDFPIATATYQRVLSLPMYPSLTDEEVLYICDSLNSILEKEPC